MTDFDELRDMENDSFELSFDDDEEFVGIEIKEGGRSFLGMTPVERMFLSVFLFMNVAVLGVALLLVTNRI